MNKINQRTEKIIEMLRGQFGESSTTKATIEKCHNPVVYIESKNPNGFPLILVSWKRSPNYEMKLYPGSSEYEIYFMDFKTQDDDLLNLMESVFLFLKSNSVKIYSEAETPVLLSVEKITYLGQEFFTESKDQVIYAQRYKLLIP